MKLYFPKLTVGFITATKPTRSINPFTTKQITLRVPVLKMPAIPFRLRNPFTKPEKKTIFGSY